MTEPAFNDWLWAQQDYLWFVSGLVWFAAGALSLRHWGAATVTWVPWSAVAGAATAITEIAIVLVPAVYVPNHPLSLRGDVTLGVILAAQAWGWWWSGLRHTSRRAVWLGFSGAVLAAAAWYRLYEPGPGAWVILAGFMGAALWWSVHVRGQQPVHRLAIWLAFAAAVTGTIGPVADAIEGPRRWLEFSRTGPWSALCSIAAGCAGLAAAQKLNLDAETGEDRSDARWFLGGLAVWLGCGLFLVGVVSAWARDGFDRNMLSRASAAAVFLPKGNIERLLDDRFKIDGVEYTIFPNGGRLPWSYSRHVEDHVDGVTDQLTTLAAAHADVLFISITTLRDDWLVGVAFSGRPAHNRGRVTLMQHATPKDREAWKAKAPVVSGPVNFSPGNRAFVRAPLIGGDGSMLGWLEFYVGVSQWNAAALQARTGMYAVVTLVAVAGWLLLVQRRRERERDFARHAAETAAAINAVKTTFLANVSHELRTPLQSIVGYADLIAPAVEPREKVRLQAIRAHADLMTRLVNDLLDLSAAETGSFRLIERPIQVREIVLQAAESLRPKAEEKRLLFSVTASPQVPSWVLGDPQRLRQVALNLAGNAVKFTERGRVDIVLSAEPVSEGCFDIRLSVADTGPGIAPSRQSDLFKPFARLAGANSTDGCGLGLSISSAICRACGGEVRLESDGIRGAVFTARWRLRACVPPDQVNQANADIGGRRILVVDDNPLVRDLFVTYLSECGALCASAVDGLEALSRLQTDAFDAVILDLAMPRLDGIAAARRIRLEHPGLRCRIVGVSAHASASEHNAALAAGMDTFLVKPVDLPELARAVEPGMRVSPPEAAERALRRRMGERFHLLAKGQFDDVLCAFEDRNWTALEARAHHLKNSADVVTDTALSCACAELQASARVRDENAAEEALRLCHACLRPWITSFAAN